MDPEQIREEITLRRASIDRKLEMLASCTRNAQQRAIRRAVPTALALIAAAVAGIWALKRLAPKPRRSLKIARRAAAFR